jgi:hypothetical protein
MYRSRPAAIGEQYVLHRFRSGTLGFVDPVDCTTAVCLPAGARLRLQSISRRLQRTYSLGPAPEAVLFRLPYYPGVHRDGLRFAAGREVLLQSLDPGASAILLPRDLEAVFDLKRLAPPPADEAQSQPAGNAHALERFACRLARLRLLPTLGRARGARLPDKSARPMHDRQAQPRERLFG